MPKPNGKPTAIKCILYARFSPRPNAAECESCELQLKDLREYAQRHGYEVVDEFFDEARSGDDDWQDRPGMFAAATACKRGMRFVVTAYDRLFRNTEKGLFFAGMLQVKGVELHSITQPAASLNTPEAKLQLGVILLVGEYQRLMSNARTKSRMLAHQKNGRRMSKLPPYGTQIDPTDPSRLIPVPDEIAVVEMVRILRTEGRGFSEIAKCLEEAGAPRRRAKIWGHQMVRRILERAE